jgi:endonuclease G
MFLRRIFPLFVFCCMAWTHPSLVILQEQAGNLEDSLESFQENFMPAFSGSEEIIRHSAFTLSYSEKHEQAKWVAYRLTAEMCNNNGEERTNNFRKDQKIKTGSSDPLDYKKSGYDRGHLCPAGDMGWSEESMSESFLMSNMSPQLPGFNRGIWKNLEGEVRKWAIENKELFVVTAGILEGSLMTIGPGKIAVPSYYYKVILDLHAPHYKAIAFVLPNEASKASVFKYAVSIDSVEHLTGIDFFPVLPDSLESNLEAHFNTNLWKTKTP